MLKLMPGNADVPVIPMEAVEIRNRFMDEMKKLNKYIFLRSM